MMLNKIKKFLSHKTKHRLRNLVADIKAIRHSDNLTALGKIYQTDKVDGHMYTPHYMFHFQKLRYERIKLLEIGVGGYDNKFIGANSLRMWKMYFPYGKIFSFDIYDKSFLQEKRIRIYQGSQVDNSFLEKITKEIGVMDIIIDDGSHINEHVIKTFKILFPKLKDGGIYVIEDTQTSYWEDYGGSSKDLNNKETMMNFFKQLTDGLNHKEFIIPEYEQSYYDKKITSIHFYHNMIFIYKGNNEEGSNMVKENKEIVEPGSK